MQRYLLAVSEGDYNSKDYPPQYTVVLPVITDNRPEFESTLLNLQRIKEDRILLSSLPNHCHRKVRDSISDQVFTILISDLEHVSNKSQHAFSQIWLIIGTPSKELGTAFVHAKISRSDKVLATARRVDHIDRVRGIGVENMPLDIIAFQGALDREVQNPI
ncbi:short-chain oxidoreductase [Penicillium herquei]|nr:short-chain oxidoreductase [Penicillium herquei]